MDLNQKERSSVLSRYFAEIREYPLLSKEQEQTLAKDVRRGCKEALDELIESNLSFVVKVASEYRNLGLPFEDLLNEGNIGLIEAAHRYDASKGTKFITYAIWWIRKAILQAPSQRARLESRPRCPTSRLKKHAATSRGADWTLSARRWDANREPGGDRAARLSMRTSTRSTRRVAAPPTWRPAWTTSSARTSDDSAFRATCVRSELESISEHEADPATRCVRTSSPWHSAI